MKEEPERRAKSAKAMTRTPDERGQPVSANLMVRKRPMD